MVTGIVRFDQLPPSIQRHYGDGSTIHEIKAWENDRGEGFKIILCDGTFSNWVYSRTIGWHISIW